VRLQTRKNQQQKGNFIRSPRGPNPSLKSQKDVNRFSVIRRPIKGKGRQHAGWQPIGLNQLSFFAIAEHRQPCRAVGNPHLLNKADLLANRGPGVVIAVRTTRTSSSPRSNRRRRAWALVGRVIGPLSQRQALHSCLQLKADMEPTETSSDRPVGTSVGTALEYRFGHAVQEPGEFQN